MKERPARRLPRRLGLLALVPVLSVALADTLIATRYDDKPRVTTSAAPTPKPSAATQADASGSDAARAHAIRAMLDARAAAVRHHDQAAFVATVDPKQPALRREQAKEFQAIQGLPIASWTYEIDLSLAQPDSVTTAKYRAPTWAPQDFSLHYRLAGFDQQPATLQQYPTFVERAGRWYLASFNDFRAEGDVSAVDIWNFGPVRVVRAPHVLVLGHPDSTALMRQVAAQASAAIPRVTAVWGKGWAQRVVLLVPDTQHELGLLVGDGGDLDQIAAVASAEVQQCPGKPQPVGSRVGINPRNWPRLSEVGRRIVLTHELTHVASRADTGSCTPTWLVEGFADYVGYLHTGIATTIIAGELRTDVLAGRMPKALPRDRDFAGSSKYLQQAYEGGWMACRLIAARYGQAALVRFYVTVGSANDPAAGLTRAFAALHLTRQRFVAEWRTYLRSQLS